jgi:GR25 family glycosyltransferase involved in LPS biosynthesis
MSGDVAKLISKIYYINLDKRVDRKEFMENQLKAFDIPCERFPAVLVEREELLNDNGKYHDYYLRCSPRGGPNFKLAIETGNRFTNVRGLIGGCISATTLYEKLLTENYDSNILILEDDCVLKAGWYEILEEFFEKYTDFVENWDMLRCVWSQENRKYVTRWTRDHRETKRAKGKTTNNYGGAHFTLINKNSIQKIYDYLISDYCLSIDGLYGTTQLNVYHAKFGGTVDYLPEHLSDCDPKSEH